MGQSSTRENETHQLISMRNKIVKAHDEIESLKLSDPFTISKEISDFVIKKLPSLQPELLKLLRRIYGLEEARKLFENSTIEAKASECTSYWLCLIHLTDANIKLNSSQIPELKEKSNLPHLKELENSELALRHFLNAGDAIEAKVHCIARAESAIADVSKILHDIVSDPSFNNKEIEMEIHLVNEQLKLFSNIAQDEAWGFDALQKEVKGFYQKAIIEFDSTFPMEGPHWKMILGILLLVIVLALLMISVSQTSTFKEYFSEETTETLDPFVAPTCGEVFRYMRELGVKDEISCKCTLKHNLQFECCLQPTKKTNKVSFSELISSLISFNSVFWIATSISMYLTVKDLLKAWVY